MDAKMMNHYRYLLEQHKERHEDIVDDMETLTLGENDNHGSSELSAYDNHPAEVASELFDREHQMGLKQLEKREIREIELALEKIRNGTYGACEKCGKDIDPGRLELIPWAKLCIDCAREEDAFMDEIKEDSKKFRPSEERVIKSADLNDSLKGEQFNDLMRYGSSDSHQDRGGEIVSE